jgi:hypothetical protein
MQPELHVQQTKASQMTCSTDKPGPKWLAATDAHTWHMSVNGIPRYMVYHGTELDKLEFEALLWGPGHACATI